MIVSVAAKMALRDAERALECGNSLPLFLSFLFPPTLARKSQEER